MAVFEMIVFVEAVILVATPYRLQTKCAHVSTDYDVDRMRLQRQQQLQQQRLTLMMDVY